MDEWIGTSRSADFAALIISRSLSASMSSTRRFSASPIRRPVAASSPMTVRRVAAIRSSLNTGVAGGEQRIEVFLAVDEGHRSGFPGWQ
ncbi:MAG: hypothetical protein V9E82_07190 [Candidatus Nanopelagicales bacterium]